MFDESPDSESARLKPRNRAEAIALFRAKLIGELIARDLDHGELADELERLSKKRFRPPGSNLSRKYSVSTLERWYYAYRAHQLAGLMPKSKRRGQALALTPKVKALIRQIATEHPRAPVSVIMRHLCDRGLIEPGTVSDNTVRRFLRAEGLDARARRLKAGGRARRRWSAPAAGYIWHADVCHGPNLAIDGKKLPVRVHGILDDRSRFLLGIKAFSTEREADMLSLFVETLQQYGRPKVLYLDNGATYRGHALHIACARLGIKLIHAEPYDPEARGKMERLWRTLRQRCLDYVGGCRSLHEVQARLLAFVEDYHAAPHSGLFASCPAEVYYREKGEGEPIGDDELRKALTVRQPRRVNRDGTLSIGGIDWEVDDGFLAGRNVTVARSLFAPNAAPWIEQEDRIFGLRPVDPVANGRKKRRAPKRPRGIDSIPFDPASSALDRLMRRHHRKDHR